MWSHSDAALVGDNKVVCFWQNHVLHLPGVMWRSGGLQTTEKWCVSMLHFLCHCSPSFLTSQFYSLTATCALQVLLGEKGLKGCFIFVCPKVFPRLFRSVTFCFSNMNFPSFKRCQKDWPLRHTEK